MNLTRRQLRDQYNRVIKLGWLLFFQEAARTITKGYYDTADLIAIGSRETNLDPKWLTKAGDGGNGFGLMQADKRSFPEFTQGDGWKDARTGILFGAKVLMQKQKDYENHIGQRRTVKGNSFTSKAASGSTAQHIVISSYNCGLWSQYAYAKGVNIDKYSTGHDYGADVMERASVIRQFLLPVSAATQPQGVTDPPTPIPQSDANTAINPQDEQPPTNEPMVEQNADTIINQPQSILDQAGQAGDKLQSFQTTLEKFGVSIEDAKRSVWTLLLTGFKSLFSILCVVGGVMLNNWELFVIAALLAVLAFLLWDRSGKRVAEAKAGIPVDTLNKMVGKV